MPITKYKLIFVIAHDFHDILNRREALQSYRGSLNQDSTIHVFPEGCLWPSGRLVLDDRAYKPLVLTAEGYRPLLAHGTHANI